MRIQTLRRFDIVLIAAGFLALTPLLSVQRTTDFMIFCIFVLSYDLLYGYMGRLSFGHMLYFGTGAYAAALTAEHLTGNPFVALAIALLAGAAIGVLLGPIIVRTTGACFALINLAFNQVGYFLALIALAAWTGGEDGLPTMFSDVGPLDYYDPKVIYGTVLLCLLLTCYVFRRLVSSPFGILLRTIKENETRVNFMGYNTFYYKWTAFIASTAIAAFAGALGAINYAYVNPSFVDPTRSVEVIFASLIGGAGSVYGALVGGVGFMAIANYLPNYIQRWEMFLGLSLLALVFWFRAGIWGFLAARVGGRASEMGTP